MNVWLSVTRVLSAQKVWVLSLHLSMLFLPDGFMNTPMIDVALVPFGSKQTQFTTVRLLSIPTLNHSLVAIIIIARALCDETVRISMYLYSQQYTHSLMLMVTKNGKQNKRFWPLDRSMEDMQAKLLLLHSTLVNLRTLSIGSRCSIKPTRSLFVCMD